eukprot:3644064-Alexandrium_andersonii.AAC.1
MSTAAEARRGEDCRRDLPRHHRQKGGNPGGGRHRGTGESRKPQIVLGTIHEVVAGRPPGT